MEASWVGYVVRRCTTPTTTTRSSSGEVRVSLRAYAACTTLGYIKRVSSQKFSRLGESDGLTPQSCLVRFSYSIRDENILTPAVIARAFLKKRNSAPTCNRPKLVVARAAELDLVFGSGCDRGEPTTALTNRISVFRPYLRLPFIVSWWRGTLQIASVLRKNAD